MRHEPEFFGDRELVLIYMARRLKHALAVERIFDEGGLDYTLETMPYQSGLLFRTTKIGLLFYAAPEDEARGRQLLLGHGYQAYDGEST